MKIIAFFSNLIKTFKMKLSDFGKVKNKNKENNNNFIYFLNNSQFNSINCFHHSIYCGIDEIECNWKMRRIWGILSRIRSCDRKNKDIQSDFRKTWKIETCKETRLLSGIFSPLGVILWLNVVRCHSWEDIPVLCVFGIYISNHINYIIMASGHFSITAGNSRYQISWFWTLFSEEDQIKYLIKWVGKTKCNK